MFSDTKAGSAYFKSLEKLRRKAAKEFEQEFSGELISPKKPKESKGLLSFRQKFDQDQNKPSSESNEPSDKFISDWFKLMYKLKNQKEV